MIIVEVDLKPQKMDLNANNVPKAIFQQQIAKHVGDAHIIKFPMRMGQNVKNVQVVKFLQKMVPNAKNAHEVIFLMVVGLDALNV